VPAIDVSPAVVPLPAVVPAPPPPVDGVPAVLLIMLSLGGSLEHTTAK
jgi:hypothetical protein